MATLHVLGSAGYHPNEWRHTTCLALPELGIVLDAGTGFFRLRDLLRRYAGGIVDVLLSHAHVDHAMGLTFYLDVARDAARPGALADSAGALTHRFRVHGAPHHLEAVRSGLFGGPLFPLPCPFEMRPVAGEFELGLARVRSTSLPHPGGSVAYRISHPALAGDLAYVTDTRATVVPRPFVAGVRTLVLECNFTDDLRELAEASLHSTLSEALRLAWDSGAERTVLIHMNPLVEQIAGRALEDPVRLGPRDGIVVARDGMVVEV